MSENDKKQGSSIKIIILMGVVSLVVGVGSGWLTNLLTAKQAKLTYDVTTQEVFPGSSQNIGIFAIRIYNEGKKEIENVIGQLKFSGASISEYKVSGIPASSRTINSTSSKFEVELPFLNPGEQLSIQILLNPTSEELSMPSIELRGKGIVGIESEKEVKPKDSLYRMLSVAIAALATLLTAISFRRTTLRKRLELEFIEDFEKKSDKSKYHSDDQRDTTSFVLELKGLTDEAKAIRSLPRKISYWSIVDSLVADWLKENNKEKILKGIEALTYLIDYAAIADSSKKLIHLNISRLALAAGNKDEANAYMQEAISGGNPIINKRINASEELSKLYGEIKPNNAILVPR